MKCKDCNTEHPDSEIANPHYCIARMGEIIDKCVEQDKQIAALTDERDGYRNGQIQMQDICSNLQDTIEKYVVERKRIREVLENIREKCRNAEDYAPVNIEIGMIAIAALEGGSHEPK